MERLINSRGQTVRCGLYIIIIMLPIEKNKDIIEQIQRVKNRADHIHEVKDQLFRFINDIEMLNSTFSQKINKEMTKFQEFVVKNSLYYEKSDHIVNLSKLYREFSIQIERNSKINLINMQSIKQDNIQKLEDKLKVKCNDCMKQFEGYTQQERNYNEKYMVYSRHCDELTLTIQRYQSYQNPIAFYNKILTSEYLSEMDKKYQSCSSSQTQIITWRQMIDEQRGNLTEHIKDVNQNYFLFVHNYLDTIQKIIKCIVYPKNEGKLDKTELNLRASNEKDNIEEQQMKELQRLESLYMAEPASRSEADNPFEEFSELFKKSVNQNQISSDHRFFYDRCESIRSKKLKTSEETFKIQNYLFDELKLQRESYENYEKSYKQIEKDNFTNNGVESYKKRFRKYFGSNFTEILELCLNLIERQKKSLQKICKNMQQGQEKMKKILENKKESIAAFERRSKVILQDHLKIKERTFSRETIDSDQLYKFKTSITESFNQIKKVFLELEKSEREDDKRYFSNLKSLYETIMKEATNKNVNKLLDKEKNRINILNNLFIDRETLSILKQDSRYENLLNECPKPNLYSTFVSQIARKEVEDTRMLLQKKEARLKNMIKQKAGCCGIKSEVIKQKVHSQHQCKLRSQKGKYKGQIFISELGLIFEQSTWNPFSQGIQLIIPQSDISSFDVKTVGEKQGVEIVTEFGALFFQSKQNSQILQSMQKNITFKPIKQPSERGKRNDSSSFIKNNTSTDFFKMSYEKSMNSNADLSRVIKAAASGQPNQKSGTGNKIRTLDQMIRDVARKWREGELLPAQRFTRVVKNVEKGEKMAVSAPKDAEKEKEKGSAQKGDMRRDYQYRQGHSKFYLKERRQCKLVEKDLVFKYEWKISFPDSPMLHSFKHHQQIRVQNMAKELRIRIISAKYFEQQLYIKNKFYKEIEEMNKLLCQFVVVMLEKEADIINEQEYDQRKSLESYNIVIDDLNLEDRDSRFERTESMLRNSRLERQRSSAAINNSTKAVQ